MPIITEIVTSIDPGLAEELKKLFVTTFMQLPPYADRGKLVLEAITKQIKLFNTSDSSHYLVIAKDNDQVVGLIFIELLKDGALYLAHGAISKSYQGRGVAKEMLKTFLTRYPNITGAFTLTREGNQAAVELYKQNGFTRNFEIYAKYPFLKAMGYDYPPFVPFEITLPLIEEKYPGIKFNFSKISGTSTEESEHKKNDVETTLRPRL